MKQSDLKIETIFKAHSTAGVGPLNGNFSLSWMFLKNHVPDDLAIPLFNIYPEETQHGKTMMSTSPLF